MNLKSRFIWSLLASLLCIFFTSAKDIYLQDLNDGTMGDGTKTNPYRELSVAVDNAENGDTIYLLSNFVHRNDALPFLINKNITIDGANQFGILFRGMHLELAGNVTFKNIGLRMLPDGSNITKIYISDYSVTFDNVNTQLSVQQDSERPTIIAGTYGGKQGNNHAQITFVNASFQSRFRKIFAGNETSIKNTPTTIILDSNTKIDEGIELSGGQDLPVNAPVEVLSSGSTKVFTNNGNSPQTKVSISDINLYNVTLQNIKDLVISKSKISTTSNFRGLTGILSITDGSFFLDNNTVPISVDGVVGNGIITLPLSKDFFSVNHNISDETTLELITWNVADYERLLGEKLISSESGNPSIIIKNSDYIVENIKESHSQYWTLKKKTLSVETLKNNKITLYPSIVTTVFHIQSEQKVNNVKILDLSGRLIKTFGNQTAYNIETLPSGVYYILLNDSQTYKIIKQNQ